jgi:thiamine-phosphate pyrophosphorylase
MPMFESCLLYYITDRSVFRGDESARRKCVLEKIAEAARADIDFIQLREKDLPTRELELFAHEAVAVLNKLRTENRELITKLLINSRTDVALATGTDGVHLRSDDISPVQVRALWAKAQGVPAHEGLQQTPLIAVSCHTLEEMKQAQQYGANFAVFAPVFEKKGAEPAGLDRLRLACQSTIPVLALGGITLENAEACLKEGAAGIAAIRLFQENNVSEVVQRLRKLD